MNIINFAKVDRGGGGGGGVNAYVLFGTLPEAQLIKNMFSFSVRNVFLLHIR